MRLEKPAIWLLILVAAYTLGHALWYWQTPLGQFPVLDGLENLLIADSIAQGNLEKAPFYRGMLYPALLAVLPIHWMALGILCHLANTLLAMRISGRLWGNSMAALITGGLVGFNPVLLHFALDPLDITFAITLFLLGVSFLIPRRGNPIPTLAHMALGGFFLSLAALARPHFFAVLFPLLFLGLIVFVFFRPHRMKMAAFAGIAIIPLVTLGFYQKAHSGTFRILPIQGAYSLWVSNNSDANGLYYKQSLNFHYTGKHQNPAQLESETLYRQETRTPGSVDERSKYWKSKTFRHIADNPIDWSRLMAFKGYAWLNNYEQYNNKTYGFHKSLSPLLKHSPIGWGLLLTLSSLCLFLATRNINKSALWTLVALISLYTAGALLYMTSARFRLPLVPLLAIIAGGIPFLFSQWNELSKRIRILSTLGASGLAALSFSTIGSVASMDTFQQDTMLLADASSRLGRDLEAFQWAERTLELNPSRQDARRLRILSFYNLVATGRDHETGKTWIDFRDDLRLVTLSDPYLDFVRGVAHWSFREPDAARTLWKDNFSKHSWAASSSLAALIYTASPINLSIPSYPAAANAPDPLLTFALNRIDQSNLRERIGFHFTRPNEFYHSVEASLKRVLPASPQN